MSCAKNAAEGYEVKNSKTPTPEPTKLDKAKAFVKRHGLEIALGAGCVAACVLYVKRGKVVEAQNIMMEAKDMRIKGLEELCAEKDAYVLKLASDALRNGSSEGGRALVDYRDFKNGRL